MMPRFLMVVHRLVLIGSWQRVPLGDGCEQLVELASSATPSDTKNSTFCGLADDSPFPGLAMLVLIAGNIESKFVSWSLFWFCPCTVMMSIDPALCAAVVRFEVRDWTWYKPAVEADVP